MGCSCGRDLDSLDRGEGRSREVQRQLEEDADSSFNIHKLLLLGPGNSGKSTFFKQIRDLYGEGWSHEQRQRFRQNVFDSILDQMQLLLSLVQDDFEVDLSQPLADYRGVDSLQAPNASALGPAIAEDEKVEKVEVAANGGEDEVATATESVEDKSTEVAADTSNTEADTASVKTTDECKVETTDESKAEEKESFTEGSKVEAAAMFLEELPKDLRINQKIAKAIALVWADPRVKDVFDCRDRIGVADSCPYFFDSIERFTEKDYVPSMDDILLARNSTVGIRETDFYIESDKGVKDHFEIFDVGGQRNERDKWLHIFDNVRAVLFVTSLSCYDQVLYEDESTNAMEESLELWEKTCNSPYFAHDHTSLVIFFNKRDLFEEKIKTRPLTTVFPDYDGPMEYQPAYEYIMKVFESQQELFEKRTIYCHATTATNRDNVKKVLYDVTHNAVVNALQANGIM